MFVWDKDDLNDEQVGAINEPESVFLIACPGSGKTRTLTYKIAKELSSLEGTKKWIVAITYTHRAADEIKERIENLGVDISQLWIGTIHSFCLEWILKPYRSYHDSLKYGFRVINSFDTEELITPYCQKYINPKVSYHDCGGYHYTSSGISYSCDAGIIGQVTEVISQYHASLISNNQIDFEQILFFAYELISQQPTISKALSGLFSYVLVDEYQDTKEIQYVIFGEILKAGKGKVKAFIVGDPNQAIYGSLGGYAISIGELRAITNITIKEKELTKNYRSSARIIKHFSYYKVHASGIVAAGKLENFPSLISYDRLSHKDELAENLAVIIRNSIETLGIPENEICIIAPWWIHLACMTRSLSSQLPQYSFNGPGLTPFARDEDNFWYKLTKIILTEPSPSLFVRRLRWSSEIINYLNDAGIDISEITKKSLLRLINSIKFDEQDGLNHLDLIFNELFNQLGIDFTLSPTLNEHYNTFFESSNKRIKMIKKENSIYAGTITDFRNVFKSKSGITVSTIHGVKGGEYDVVIAYGLLEDIVPHFNDKSYGSANKLIYVIGSRARKHLHLISEQGRGNKWYPKVPTNILNGHSFDYDSN
ncbi:UvrD-helicase domain-containing protein [Colwellia sp. Bg11-28]|uniref:UvrD-helicase domain-containing protein n=1 Tax=Colwellia sp. Bg11-28 TaxID=2058305 RepID=UPI000C324E27|nr:ATP-dependent helicase [Colwellia sp. Bg11-28]PKH89523.1 ATP-dependent helicase [Colwellia sp. Bg11-28]